MVQGFKENGPKMTTMKMIEYEKRGASRTLVPNVWLSRKLEIQNSKFETNSKFKKENSKRQKT